MSSAQSAKVVLLGDGGVGKTSLLNAIRGQAITNFYATIATEIVRLPLQLDQYRESARTEDGGTKDIVFWDTPGQGSELDYRYAMMNCHAALVVVRSEYFRGYETSDEWSRGLQRFCPSAARVLVALQSGRGPSRFGPEQFHDVTHNLGFDVALEVDLNVQSTIDELIRSIAGHVLWKDVPTLSGELYGVKTQLLDILNREIALSATRVGNLASFFHISTSELWNIVNSLCDVGEVVVLSDGDHNPLYVAYEQWSSEAEQLDMMTRASNQPDGSISPVLPQDNKGPLSSVLRTAVITQLVDAGYYTWKGDGLVRWRSSRLAKPIRCFVSHSSSDGHIAAVIARVLRSRNIEVWLDSWEMKAGDSIVARIEDGLESATAVLALISNSSLRSPWVQEELRMAVYRKVTDSKFRVVPVVLEDCDVPGFLRGLARLDWRQDGEDGILRIADQLHEARSGQ